MTDKEVSKLTRRDFLELLLETQTENEALQSDCENLYRQLAAATEALEKTQEELRKAQGTSAGADWQAATLLKEAREAADSVAATQREQHQAQEQLLQEREKHLQERERHLLDRDESLSRQEDQVHACLREAEEKASLIVQEARQSAAEIRRNAEAEASACIRSAESAAADTLREAREAAARTEHAATALAEKMIRQAREDSDSFWADVSAALEKRFFPTEAHDEST